MGNRYVITEQITLRGFPFFAVVDTTNQHWVSTKADSYSAIKKANELNQKEKGSKGNEKHI